jgi:hypothetical protein
MAAKDGVLDRAGMMDTGFSLHERTIAKNGRMVDPIGVPSNFDDDRGRKEFVRNSLMKGKNTAVKPGDKSFTAVGSWRVVKCQCLTSYGLLLRHGFRSLPM